MPRFTVTSAHALEGPFAVQSGNLKKVIYLFNIRLHAMPRDTTSILQLTECDPSFRTSYLGPLAARCRKSGLEPCQTIRRLLVGLLLLYQGVDMGSIVSHLAGAKLSPIRGPQQAQHGPALQACTEAALMRAWTGFSTHVMVKHLIKPAVAGRDVIRSDLV